MVTGDKNLSYKQNLAARKLALVVLSTNNWNILKRNPHFVTAASRRGDCRKFPFRDVRVLAPIGISLSSRLA
jgi:hypothetical protein